MTLTNLSLYLIVQIYLSISRADLAKKEFALAKANISSASDSLLFALTEAAIGLATGGAPLVSAYHIYDEQVSAPGSSQNANIIASKGVAELLRGHVTEALGSFDEALSVDPLCADALVGRTVGKQLTAKQAEADEAFEYARSSAPFSRPNDHCIAVRSKLRSLHTHTYGILTRNLPCLTN